MSSKPRPSKPESKKIIPERPSLSGQSENRGSQGRPLVWKDRFLKEPVQGDYTKQLIP